MEFFKNDFLKYIKLSSDKNILDINYVINEFKNENWRKAFYLAKVGAIATLFILPSFLFIDYA